jgi:hypothetical protein
MKTTQFFPEIKKVAKDSTMHIVFSYEINPKQNFFQIFLHSEPTDKVKALCEKRGFSIKQNTLSEMKDGQMVQTTIWELLPNDLTEIETTDEEVLNYIGKDAVIATVNAMADSGLFKCTKTDETLLWFYEWNITLHKWGWMPIIHVYNTPILDDILDENGEVKEPKSTHKIGDFYFTPVQGRFDCRPALAKHGITIQEL